MAVNVDVLKEYLNVSDMEKTREHLNSQGITSLSVSEEHSLEMQADSYHFSVTAVLSYCKKKILTPYLRILCVMGLRPFGSEQNCFCCLDLLSYLYTLAIILLVTLGYVLQYMTCFRRDRGFGYKTIATASFVSLRETNKLNERVCHGSIVFSYVIPSFLHLCAYFYAVLVFRTSEDDQLPSLMERVFLYSSNLREGFSNQKKIVKMLWIFVLLSLVWMILSFVSVNVMMAAGNINFKWIDDWHENIVRALKILLITCTLSHDMIQATVVSNYCLQAQLLTCYLRFLRDKLIQNPIQTTEWMQDFAEFKKLLRYFNKELGPSVCVFTIINVSWVVSGTFWILKFDHVDHQNLQFLGITVLNLLLWATIAAAPFVQAARLTNACSSVKSIGHEIRTRPFGYQDTPDCNLDTLLLYTSTLKMSAQLFGVPITAKYLYLLTTITAIVLLVLGQLHYIV